MSTWPGASERECLRRSDTSSLRTAVARFRLAAGVRPSACTTALARRRTEKRAGRV